jgi:nudix-type nucleoside diphosphatase (YffH/AdpP family)
MSYFGHLTSADVARRLPVIRARAQAQLFARHTTPHPLDPSTTEDVRVLDRRRPYSEFFSSEEVDLKHRRFDGEMSGEMTRAVFVGCDAVIVLPYDPIRDRVLLVEQFRAGPFVRGDQNPWSLEPIAGRIEGGQTPTAAAHREALEEANLTFTHLEAVSGAYPSPSCMSEYYHLFTGLCDLPDDITGLAGLEQEHEDIKSHVLQFDDLMYHVQAGCMTNAPLILLTYWLAYHRNRLRARMA